MIKEFIFFAMPYRPRTTQRRLRLNPAEAGRLARGSGATRIRTSP